VSAGGTLPAAEAVPPGRGGEEAPDAGTSDAPAAPLWTPDEGRRAAARIVEFARRARAFGAPDVLVPGNLLDYPALHAWSLAAPEAFWQAVWDFCGVRSEAGPVPAGAPAAIGADRMAPPDPVLGPRWFPGARLNYAENLLQAPADADQLALVGWTEAGRQGTLTYAELRREVARFADGLRAAGVGEGDRVAGFLPNVPQAVVAMLAAASLGAVWSSASPDFGTAAVVDRFGQIAPKVLVAADACRYQGKRIDCLLRVREIAGLLPSLERVVIVPMGDGPPELGGVRDAVLWDDFLGEATEPVFARLPFDHPLWILYSSGTTGLPKSIVHGAGGSLIQHLKELVLHTDLRAGDTIFFHTTCGWMMWNWLVSGLAVGATVVLYDGAPHARSPTSARGPGAAGGPDILWTLAEAERVNVFGVSARYLALMEKAGVRPRETHELPALRAVLSTGSPLPARSFAYVYSDVAPDVHLASISGGTDIVSCFMLGVPTDPVWAGEIQRPGLAMALEIRSPKGARVVGEAGELVCTRPFPSMPIRFENDPDGARYRAAYFEHLPGVWRHGDWAEETAHGGYVIHGRSDATLNPGGVRIGTAEIYRQVEAIEEVMDAVAVGVQTDPKLPGDVRIALFVRLRDGATLDSELQARIRRRIREGASPHHVPQIMVQVPDLPRTVSGKLSEIAVREAVHGRAVTNIDALANPEVLAHFRPIALEGR